MDYSNYQQNRSYNGGRERIGGQRYNSYGDRSNGSQRYGSYGNRDNSQPDPKQVFAEAGFKSSWITGEVDCALPTFADKMGKEMATGGLTNSKIRNIYGEIKRIQMGEFENEKASFYLLRPKVAYALGRDPQNKGLQLFKLVFDKASESVTDKKSYKNFCNLIEAILAYHKAYGGKD